jgi:hypothetical protein
MAGGFLQIKEIAEDFLRSEDLPLAEALDLGSIGLSKATGMVSRIVYDVGFSHHAYTAERKQQIKDAIGEAFFHIQVLALTCGEDMDAILQEWVREWLMKRNLLTKDGHVSIVEMRKYLKEKVQIAPKDKFTTQLVK